MQISQKMNSRFLGTSLRRKFVAETTKSKTTSIKGFAYDFNGGIPYLLTKDQKYPSVQKEYAGLDFDTDSPAMTEKGYLTAKLAYLKMLEVLTDSKGVKSRNKLSISIEPVFESRII